MGFIWVDLRFWFLGFHRCHELALLWGFGEGEDDPSSTCWPWSIVLWVLSGEIWDFGAWGSIDATNLPSCEVLVKVRMIPTQPVGRGTMGYGFYLGRLGDLVLRVP